jgi:hypothetical protein
MESNRLAWRLSLAIGRGEKSSVNGTPNRALPLGPGSRLGRFPAQVRSGLAHAISAPQTGLQWPVQRRHDPPWRGCLLIADVSQQSRSGSKECRRASFQMVRRLEGRKDQPPSRLLVAGSSQDVCQGLEAAGTVFRINDWLRQWDRRLSSGRKLIQERASIAIKGRIDCGVLARGGGREHPGHQE